MNIAARTKVNLKITFSKPRLVKDDPLDPRPKPVPFDWIRIVKASKTPTIIWTIKTVDFIVNRDYTLSW